MDGVGSRTIFLETTKILDFGKPFFEVPAVYPDEGWSIDTTAPPKLVCDEAKYESLLKITKITSEKIEVKAVCFVAAKCYIQFKQFRDRQQ